MLYKYIVPIILAIFLTGFTANSLKAKENKEFLDNYIDNSQIFVKSETVNEFQYDDIQTKLLMTAYKEIGNVGGEKYWSWYGFNGPTAWCCCFVSWCADQCGLVEKGIIPKFASVSQGYNWFASKGLIQNSSIIPSTGMIAFFDYPEDDGGTAGFLDHVGIVKCVKDGYIYVIEGNYNNVCAENKYAIGNNMIVAYATPDYE